MGEARATGLFAAHLGLTPEGLVLDWQDAEFIPFDHGYFAFVYDKRRTIAPPLSFEELIARPDSFKIVIEDPRSSTCRASAMSSGSPPPTATARPISGMA